MNIVNKWKNTSKYISITPNHPLHIEFDFEQGTMEKTNIYVLERINGVWEANSQRDAIYNLEDGHYEMDLILTGDYIRIQFTKEYNSVL